MHESTLATERTLDSLGERQTDLFVPGRLCLFGEHSDWAGGYRDADREIAPGECLVAGTEQGLRAAPEPTSGFLELSVELPGNTEVEPERIPIDPVSLTATVENRGFFSYAAATWAELRARYPVEGLRMDVVSDLPVGKGLSSSAAICVLMARAASRAYGLGLTVEQEMDVAYAGERRTGSECGRMDQICAFGRGPVAMHIDGEAVRFEPVHSGGLFHLLIVDLCRAKDTRKILADLNACFPATVGPIAAAVREALGVRNQVILSDAKSHLAAGNNRALGELMTAAQQIFDEQIAPACTELASPRLHEVLDHPAVRELGWGGKGVGSQGDGSAQILARGPEERERLAETLEERFGVRCLALTLEETVTASATRS